MGKYAYAYIYPDILFPGIVSVSDLFNLFHKNLYSNIVFTQLLTTKYIGIKYLTSDYPVDNSKSFIKYLQTYYSSLCP